MSGYTFDWLQQLEEALSYLDPEMNPGVEEGNQYSPNPRYIVSLTLNLTKDSKYCFIQGQLTNNESFTYWFHKDNVKPCKKAYSMLNALMQHSN